MEHVLNYIETTAVRRFTKMAVGCGFKLPRALNKPILVFFTTLYFSIGKEI